MTLPHPLQLSLAIYICFIINFGKQMLPQPWAYFMVQNRTTHNYSNFVFLMILNLCLVFSLCIFNWNIKVKLQPNFNGFLLMLMSLLRKNVYHFLSGWFLFSDCSNKIQTKVPHPAHFSRKKKMIGICFPGREMTPVFLSRWLLSME